MIRGLSVPNLDTPFDGLPHIANLGRSALEGIGPVDLLVGPTALVDGDVGRIGGMVPKRAGDENLTRMITDEAG